MMLALRELVDRSQLGENARVALLSISTCSQGLILTAADTVVFAEWTPGLMMQAAGRVLRIGQRTAANTRVCIC